MPSPTRLFANANNDTISEVLEQHQEYPEMSSDSSDHEETGSGVLFELCTTASDLRERCTEHRKLHAQMTVHLKSLSHRCLAQERQIISLSQELQAVRTDKDNAVADIEDLQNTYLDVTLECKQQASEAKTVVSQQTSRLQVENYRLANDNQMLRERLRFMQAESSEKQVVVNAMTGAVAGLEGWIESASASSSPARNGINTPRKMPAKKRGRFRGRQDLAASHRDSVSPPLTDSVLDMEDLQEGVKAWVRGFRDVEESLQPDSYALTPFSNSGGEEVSSTGLPTNLTLESKTKV